MLQFWIGELRLRNLKAAIRKKDNRPQFRISERRAVF